MILFHGTNKHFDTIALYISGIYTTKQAIEQLKYFNVNDQISFHTEKALRCLVWKHDKEV